ncbi:methyltransferase, TIGR04325 family [Acuticoccus sp. M5D2P5]|uniref:methyltransferase, TIGR04325 family n=1 Tax=Acuticoccus kalidii TaxID=2910977 RepID=UPI001F30F99E|nr:methyltransferase, TIGR04325 family [Acuticoccus kalidii]MCF3935161.1 methyltransferase, TIGR04325 family [Acuticoccus kalidii]
MSLAKSTLLPLPLERDRSPRRLLSRLKSLPAIAACRSEFWLRPHHRSFMGAYRTFAEAIAAAPTSSLAGCDHAEIAEIGFATMCELAIWDYPVLFWLDRLGDSVTDILDVGGHMGTKFRAFDPHLDVRSRYRWTIVETPAICAAGRRRAEADGLAGALAFIDDPAKAPAADLLLASGVFQYIDASFGDLVARLERPPAHILLNKVATRTGPTVVTLERIGAAHVPYQIRSLGPFLDDAAAAGYEVVDEWTIPDLSHRVRSHPELGRSVSRGFYLRRRDETGAAS